MTSQVCTVAVKQLPERLSGKHARIFFNGLGSSMNTDRACIVLDCSQVRQMDRSAVYRMLCCLEEAIRRDGDIKLAAIPPAARAILELTGAGRLFESFETNAAAVSSFRRLAISAPSNGHVQFGSHPAP